MPDRALEDPTRHSRPHGKNISRTRTCLVRKGGTTTVQARLCVQEAAKGSGLQDGQPQLQDGSMPMQEAKGAKAPGSESDACEGRHGCRHGTTVCRGWCE
ncbi:hypothetical protein GCM10010403_37710 [Glycomyces rutgersensis]|uniref:Uncharacterized protein n=1 Tax=Glycomyces rutgersensis TaxID=58115 RepID=A0ABN3G047_9ACTN